MAVKSYHGEHIGFDFSGMDLRNATLSGEFTGCDFSGCDLRGAQLVGTFQDCDFTGVIMDSTTSRIGRFA